MSEKHPPVPPNCPWFDTDRDGSNWFMYPGQETGMGMHEVVWLDGPMCAGHHRDVVLRDFRPIIAAVARCAWLDEIERLRPAMNGESRTMAAFKGITASGKLMVKAGQNASAWVKWARGEAWE